MTTDEFTYELDETERPSMAIVRAVAALRGVIPADVPPLGRRIDADALDSFVRNGASVTCTFRFDGILVSVSNERIVVELPETD
jgi:hypothetical protein